jgi:cytochrome c
MNTKQMSNNTWALVALTLGVLISCQSNKNTADSSLPPDENRFTTTVLSQAGDLDEPMAFTFVDNEEMLIVERKGGVKAFNVESREMREVGFVPVNTKYTNKEGNTREAEEGLMGVIAHPDYDDNNWVFMFYADPETPKHVLARWEYKEGSIVESSKKVVLEIPTQREECCHTGGGMVFDEEGNLYLTTGNNTVNPPQGTSNLDERPGFKVHDDQRTAGNTNDLRGKILRIHPEDDGSYTIPKGNLFPEGTEKARPEIYTMGHRNPWRISIDSETRYIYWGEVGPDASEDTEVGPRGYDEFNQAKGPGFFGWPYFIGDNKPYVDSLGNPFDPAQPVNYSPNNTGLNELPPAQKAFIWYPYSNSEEFPMVGSAGRSATGGPIFRQADFPKSDNRFPAYYEGKWLMTEFMRGWIMAITMDKNGDYLSMEQFLPNENFSSAIDMIFSPAGDLYVLEYGSAWFRGNENAQIKQIRYNGGNRAPVVLANADKRAGSTPLQVQLSSDGTLDFDEDKLSYQWTVTSDNGYSRTVNGPNPNMTFEEPGVYQAKLVVSDAGGKSDEQVLEIVAGNEPPKVDIELTEGNQSFFFPGSKLAYSIVVEDVEDGAVSTGDITKEAVAINFDYVPEGFDPIEIAATHKSTDDWVTFSKGKSLINESDCLACHRIDVKSIGPSYMEVAQTYKNQPAEIAKLAGKIKNGSVGVWGEHAMSAHPDLSESDAQLMVDYIMSLNDPQLVPVYLPISGTFTPQAPEAAAGKGGYLLRAAYTDQGADGLKSLASEKIIALRNPVIDPEEADESKGMQILITPRRSINIIEDNAYMAFKNLDLTGVKEIKVVAEAPGRANSPGGTVEARLGSPDGELLGSSEKIEQVNIDFRAELRKMREAWEKGGQKGPRPGFGDVRDKFQPKILFPVNKVGKHDVYFVIRNPEAKEGEILLQFDNIEFKNTSTVQ